MGLTNATDQGAAPPSALAAAFGLKDWTFHPAMAVASQAPTSQTIYAVAVPLLAGVSYTGLALFVSTPGTGAPPTNFYVGMATSAATGVMLTQSSDLAASAALTTAGVQRFPFAAPYLAPAAALTFALVLENGAFAGTALSFGRPALASHTAISGTFWCALAGTGRTALPANGAALPSAYSEPSSSPYWVGLY